VSPRTLGPAATVIGITALIFSVLYFVSDVIEVIQGGFSVGQLWLTLAAEAAIPIFVVGLAILYRPRLGRLGQFCAWAYAYSYVVFTGTVVYALANHTKDYQTLSDQYTADGKDHLGGALGGDPLSRASERSVSPPFESRFESSRGPVGDRPCRYVMSRAPIVMGAGYTAGLDRVRRDRCRAL
jgi:hypothetical protein